MKTNRTRNFPSAQPECHRTRVAESSIAAVDVCACGLMQVHVGAVTLRMVPEAVAELLSTLEDALAAQTPEALEPEPTTGSYAFGGGERGKA